MAITMVIPWASAAPIYGPTLSMCPTLINHAMLSPRTECVLSKNRFTCAYVACSVPACAFACFWSKIDIHLRHCPPVQNDSCQGSCHHAFACMRTSASGCCHALVAFACGVLQIPHPLPYRNCCCHHRTRTDRLEGAGMIFFACGCADLSGGVGAVATSTT